MKKKNRIKWVFLKLGALIEKSIKPYRHYDALCELEHGFLQGVHYFLTNPL